MNILKREDPQTILNILNKKQSILVMKQAPKNGEGCWWYLYCGEGDYLTFEYVSVDNTLRTDYPWCYQVVKKLRNDEYVRHTKPLNGKVVARFWCDKVEGILNDFNTKYNVAVCSTVSLFHFEILDKSCLQQNQLTKYLENKNGYAIHISKLEIFDRPRELNEFYKVGFNKALEDFEKEIETLIDNHQPHPISFYSVQKQYEITKAPQNYCYVEGE